MSGSSTPRPARFASDLRRGHRTTHLLVMASPGGAQATATTSFRSGTVVLPTNGSLANFERVEARSRVSSAETDHRSTLYRGPLVLIVSDGDRTPDVQGWVGPPRRPHTNANSALWFQCPGPCAHQSNLRPQQRFSASITPKAACTSKYRCCTIADRRLAFQDLQC